MRRILDISVDEITPDRRAILLQQGIPPDKELSPRVEELLQTAGELFVAECDPLALYEEIELDEFEAVYAGEGNNASPTPLERVYPRAQHLALFAVTLGEALGETIAAHFKGRDFALGSLLDAAASAGAEMLAGRLQQCYERELAQRAGGKGGGHEPASSDGDGARGVLRYSPGYCGWHISGQKRLFARLRPEELGISLRPSFLMEPLKSISGVAVSGPAHIHDFPDDFVFCDDCSTHECRERIRCVLNPSHEDR